MEKQAFLVHLYKNKNAADTTFVVEGKQFHAHKLIILDHAKKTVRIVKRLHERRNDSNYKHEEVSNSKNPKIHLHSRSS